MPYATLDGIKTYYEKTGNGPALLMFASRGFNSTIDSWLSGKTWKEMDCFNTLSRHFTMIAYDRREAGRSGGRVEVLTWEVFAKQGKLLLEHLGFEQTWVIGPCMGVSVATKYAAVYPETCLGMLLLAPVGGHHWMMKGVEFCNRHVKFVREKGLAACVERAPVGRNFWEDPEPGPWAAQLCSDPAFAARYVKQDLGRYLDIVVRTRDALFPDTFCAGATPRELLAMDIPALVIPGGDQRHTVSAANQLRELLPRVEYWDMPASKQNGQNTFEQLVAFKKKVESGGMAKAA